MDGFTEAPQRSPSTDTPLVGAVLRPACRRQRGDWFTPPPTTRPPT